MKVLITGASGFIGGHVVNCCLNKSLNHTYALITRNSNLTALNEISNIKYIKGSLDDLDTIKNELLDFSPDVCIHLAWSGIPNYSPQISTYNLNISVNLTDFLLNNTKCKKIIVSGSCFEYGKASGECRESDPVKLDSYVAWAKHSLYKYSLLRCIEKSVDLYWLRFFYVYGSFQRSDSLIPTIVNTFKNLGKPDIKFPFNANDFVYVEDIADAIRIILDSKPNPGIYNLGSGAPTSVIDICEIIERKICNSTNFSDSLRSQEKCNNTTSFWANTKKATTLLNWEPKVSIYKGVEKQIETILNKT